MATVLVGFEAGAKMESKFGYNSGVAHTLEHNIFKHCNGKNAIDIQKQIGYLGGSANAYTSHDSVAYYIELPLDNLEQGMTLLRDMISDAIVDDDDFAKEMNVIKEEEISGRDSISRYMWQNFSKNYFSNHLSVPVIGTQDSISSITKDEMQRFHSNFCSMDRAIVCLSANMTKKDASRMMTGIFGKKSGKIKRTNMKQSSYLDRREVETYRSDIEHTYVWLGMPNKITGNKFLPESTIIDVILGSGMDSRLFSEIRERRGLVYSISSSSMFWQSASLNLFSCSTRSKNTREVLGLIEEEVSLIQNDGFEEEEIIRAKNKIKSSFYRVTESSSGLVHNGFSSIIKREPDLDSFMTKIDLINNDDLVFAANTMYDLDKSLVLICENKDEN